MPRWYGQVGCLIKLDWLLASSLGDSDVCDGNIRIAGAAHRGIHIRRCMGGAPPVIPGVVEVLWRMGRIHRHYSTAGGALVVGLFWHALARFTWVASTCFGGSWSLLPIDAAVVVCALCHVPLVLTCVLVVALFGSCVPRVWLGLCNLPSGLLVACPIVPCRGVCSWFLLPGCLVPIAAYISWYKAVVVQLVCHIPRISVAKPEPFAESVSWHG